LHREGGHTRRGDLVECGNRFVVEISASCIKALQSLDCGIHVFKNKITILDLIDNEMENNIINFYVITLYIVNKNVIIVWKIFTKKVKSTIKASASMQNRFWLAVDMLDEKQVNQLVIFVNTLFLDSTVDWNGGLLYFPDWPRNTLLSKLIIFLVYIRFVNFSQMILNRWMKSYHSLYFCDTEKGFTIANVEGCVSVP